MNRWLINFFFLFSCSLHAQNIRVKKLQCEYLTNPLGIESLQPQLSWQTMSSQRNILQSAYRVLVADNLASIHKDIWQCMGFKKVSSGQSIQIVYAGQQLKAAKTYYWKVMVWDNLNHASAWSREAVWQMGLPTPADWKGAQWIAYDIMPDSLRITPVNSEQKRMAVKDVLPLLRKAFTINKAVKKATVFISGLGHFELSVNGKKAGDHFLDPGWTNYNKHALYVSFDVTGSLQKGANVLGVMLGNGFYFIPGERYRKLQLCYGFPKMICRLLVEYYDGSTEDVITDPSWRTAPGPVTFASIYGGEDYNASLEQPVWNAQFFNDRLWKAPLIVDGPPVLNAQTAEPVKIFDHFVPKKVTQPKTGVWVYDVGQNASGIPFISVRGKKGAVVRLWPSELLDKNGLVTTAPIGAPVYFDYTLKGKGIETWQPRFMYYGFRYV